MFLLKQILQALVSPNNLATKELFLKPYWRRFNVVSTGKNKLIQE